MFFFCTAFIKRGIQVSHLNTYYCTFHMSVKHVREIIGIPLLRYYFYFYVNGSLIFHSPLTINLFHWSIYTQYGGNKKAVFTMNHS